MSYYRYLPDDDEWVEMRERMYERQVLGRGPVDYRNAVPVGSRLSVVEYQDDDDGRDWS